jgi:hypothetical protein
MSDFETRARAAADALNSDHAFGDPSVVRNRLRRRRVARLVASGAAVVVGVGVIAVARGDGPLRIGTTGSTISPSGNGTTSAPAEDSTTLSPNTAAPPPPTIPLPDATSAPALLVATDQGCVRRVLGAADVIAAATDHARRCFALSDSSMVAERGEPGSTVLTRFVTGTAPVDLPLTNPYMLGAGDIAGRAVLFVVLPAPPGTENQAPITVYDVASGSRRDFGFGTGADSGTSRVSTDGRFIVASENADMGVSLSYYNVDGTDAVGLPDLSSQMKAYPSDDVVQLVFSPDGKRLAYLDGPAYVPLPTDFGPDPNDHWALVVVDVETGHELQRTVLSTGQDEYTWLDYDGRWAVASRTTCARGWTDCVTRAAVVVDTQAPHPTPAQIPGAPGTTTLDSAP